MKSKLPRAKQSEAELYEYAVRALGRKMRTVAELKRLMRTRVPEEGGDSWIENVIAKLKEQRYLNDTQFANTYTKLRQENQRFGRRRVQQELMQKGVHAEIISTTIGAAYEGKDEAAMAREFLERKRVAKPKDEKETARIMRMMARAGYSSGAIWKVLRSWNVEAPETEME